jgi:hypothetical protein
MSHQYTRIALDDVTPLHICIHYALPLEAPWDRMKLKSRASFGRKLGLILSDRVLLWFAMLSDLVRQILLWFAILCKAKIDRSHSSALFFGQKHKIVRLDIADDDIAAVALRYCAQNLTDQLSSICVPEQPAGSFEMTLCCTG